jgi:hypothetical protein
LFDLQGENGMKKTLVVFVVLGMGLVAQAQNPNTTDPAKWPVCRLGAAPIAPGPAPSGAVVFKTEGGPVVMTEAGPNGLVRSVRCRLTSGVEVYRSADGTLRDLPSNQPFWPINWDASPPPSPKDGTNGANGTNGRNGRDGVNGINGRNGFDGRNGHDGQNATAFAFATNINHTVAGGLGPKARFDSDGWSTGKKTGVAVAVIGGTVAVVCIFVCRGGGNKTSPTTTTTPPKGPGAITGPAF